MTKISSPLLLAMMALMLAGSAQAAAPQDTKEKAAWRVPSRHARKKNPQEATPESIAAGRAIYVRECLSCHGESGRGDGSASKDLEVKPADFLSLTVRKQSDGALYWMIGTGRSPMPTFKDSLSSEQRWNVVNYVRTLAPHVDAAAAKALADPLGGVLASYGRLHTALATSTVESSLKEAAKLAQEAKGLAAYNPPKLSKADREVWAAKVKELREAADAVHAAKDLEAVRASFARLSTPLVATLKMLPLSGRQALRLFNCPHANGGKSATWLQSGAKPVNPYSVDRSSCGELKEQIPQPPVRKKVVS